MRRLAVRGIIVQQNRLLCVKHKTYGGVTAKDFWCLPGGTVDEGETLIGAMEREMMEETAIKPTVGKLLYINHFAWHGKEHVEFFFHITNSSDYLDIDLSKASHAEVEIAQIDFIDPTQHYVLPEFLSQKTADNHLTADAQIISRL